MLELLVFDFMLLNIEWGTVWVIYWLTGSVIAYLLVYLCVYLLDYWVFVLLGCSLAYWLLANRVARITSSFLFETTITSFLLRTSPL